MAHGFVRLATATDAPTLAKLQQDSRAARYALLLPPEALTANDESVANWERLCQAADADGHTLALMAVDDAEVVGILASIPATDPDLPDREWVEIAELAVADGHTGEGHGSRLLAAWADLCRDSPATVGGIMWVPASDDELRGLLTAAGFAPDGAHRTLDLHGDGTVTVRMLRFASLLNPPD